MTVQNRANVVVIGAGVYGASAAFHLARAGQKNVVLLDRGPIAGGTTPFAAGQTGYLNVKKSAVSFSRYCIEFFENFERETGYPIEFKQNGSIRIAVSKRNRPDLDAMAAIAREFGDAVEFLTPAGLRKLVPALEITEAAGILHVPRDGYTEPKAVAVGYAVGARDLGVKIHTHTPVTGFDVANGRVRSVHTAYGPIQTDWVVLAAGAWTRNIARQFGADIKSVPVRHQAFVTVPLGGVRAKQPVVRIADEQIYVRPEGGGLLVGGYGYEPASFEMSQLPESFEIPALPADEITRRALRDQAAKYFPVLRDAPIVQDRRGLPTITPDSAFMVSELDRTKGVIVATGCLVGGIHSSPGVGRIVADLVSGRKSFELAPDLLANRFEGMWNDDLSLRRRCEKVYATMYWGIPEILGS